MFSASTGTDFSFAETGFSLFWLSACAFWASRIFCLNALGFSVLTVLSAAETTAELLLLRSVTDSRRVFHEGLETGGISAEGISSDFSAGANGAANAEKDISSFSGTYSESVFFSSGINAPVSAGFSLAGVSAPPGFLPVFFREEPNFQGAKDGEEASD